MTDTLVGMDPQIDPGWDPGEQELTAARELVRQAQAAGLSLTGPDGLLKHVTKSVIEAALDEEMSEHLGYDNRQGRGRPWPGYFTAGATSRSSRTSGIRGNSAGPCWALPLRRSGSVWRGGSRIWSGPAPRRWSVTGRCRPIGSCGSWAAAGGGWSYKFTHPTGRSCTALSGSVPRRPVAGRP